MESSVAQISIVGFVSLAGMFTQNPPPNEGRILNR